LRVAGIPPGTDTCTPTHPRFRTNRSPRLPPGSADPRPQQPPPGGGGSVRAPMCGHPTSTVRRAAERHKSATNPIGRPQSFPRPVRRGRQIPAPPTSDFPPSHVLKGHSFIAQGSPRSGYPGLGSRFRFISEGDGLKRAIGMNHGPNSTRRIRCGNRHTSRFPPSLSEANPGRVQAS